MMTAGRKATLSDYRLVERWRGSACKPPPDVISLLVDLESPLRHGSHLANLMLMAACGMPRADLSDEAISHAFEVLAYEIKEAAEEAAAIWDQLHDIVRCQK